MRVNGSQRGQSGRVLVTAGAGGSAETAIHRPRSYEARERSIPERLVKLVRARAGFHLGQGTECRDQPSPVLFHKYGSVAG